MQLTAMLYQTVNQFVLSASFKLGSVLMCDGMIDTINPGSNFKGDMTGGKCFWFLMNFICARRP